MQEKESMQLPSMGLTLYKHPCFLGYYILNNPKNNEYYDTECISSCTIEDCHHSTSQPLVNISAVEPPQDVCAYEGVDLNICLMHKFWISDHQKMMIFQPARHSVIEEFDLTFLSSIHLLEHIDSILPF